MYTEQVHDKELEAYSVPEIQRIELSSMILQLAVIGVENIVTFDFIEGPSPETVSRALENLIMMEALKGEDGSITKKGQVMAQFPLDPKITQCLLKSFELGCEKEMLRIIAVLSAGQWKVRPREKQHLADYSHSKFATSNCDFSTAGEVLRQFQQSND